MQAKLNETIQELFPKYLTFLSRLVRIPSLIGYEKYAQSFVAESMKEIGLKIDAFEIDPELLKNHPQFVQDDRSYKNRPIVVGNLKGSENGRSLIMNAHCDTAPAGDLRDWIHDPFCGEIHDGKLYGRGAWDDKAGIAVMLLICESLIKAKVPIKGDLIFQSVIEDEVTGNGTLACLERGYTASNAIILDGTWAERIIDAHMGQVWFRVEILGRSAPACSSFRGENPIYHVDAILKSFQRLVSDKNSKAKPWGLVENPNFINVGKITSGAWPGSVPVRCILECQAGFCPPQTIADIKEEIVACLMEVSRNDSWLRDNPLKINFFGLSVDPVIAPLVNPVTDGILIAVKNSQGKEALVTPVTGHGDIRHFYNHSIPACFYGPGEGKNAHVENEYYVISEMPVVAQNIANYILSLWNLGV